MKLKLTTLLLLLVHLGFSQERDHVHAPQLALIENKGQWPEGVFFQSRSQGQNVWVQQHGFLYDLRYRLPHADFSQKIDTTLPSFQLVSAYFLGSQEVQKVEKNQPTAHYFNYFLGNDQSKWATDVHGYGEVVLKDLYPNVDLHVFDQNQLKYEIWCYPGSDLSTIRLALNGTDNISISEDGRLMIPTKLGTVIEEKPEAFVLRNGSYKKIDCQFELKENVVTWTLGKHDPNDVVIIDPQLIFATYSGSTTDNFGMTATYDYNGFAFSGGTVFGTTYPAPDPGVFSPTANTPNNIFSPQSGWTSPSSDVFISKYATDGTTMLWTNFLGGNTSNGGTETVHSLICDKQDNLYAFGATSSYNFPIQNGYQATNHGGSQLNVTYNGAMFGTTGIDIWVAKISGDGHTLMGSTYMGGSANDGANYNAYGGDYSGAQYYDSLTHNYGDQFRGEIMLDPSGNCLVASSTHSTDFPVQNAFQPANAGMQDGVLFKLSPDLSTLMWSSYFGGSNNDGCYSVKIDSSLNVVFAGGTCSSNLPATSGAYLPNFQNGKTDGYAGKLAPNGQTLTRVSYIGADDYDQVMFVEINRNDEIFLYGQSDGSSFPIINATGDAGAGQFIIKLNPDLSAVLNSKTFGWANHNSNVSPAAFLVDICGNMYVTAWGGNVIGSTPSHDLPVTSDAMFSTPPNGFDFYLGVFKNDFIDQVYGTWIGGIHAKEHVDGGTSRFDKNGIVYQSVCGGCGGFSDFPTTPNAWSNNNLSSNCNNIIFKFDFGLIPDASFTTSEVAGCAPFTVTFTNTSKPSDSYEWDFGNGQTSSTTFSPVITYADPGVYHVRLVTTDSICLLRDTSEITVTVTAPFPVTVSNDTTLCIGGTVTLTADSDGIANEFVWSSAASLPDTLNSSLSDSTFTQNVSETTTFYVMASNGDCHRLDSVTVYVLNGGLELTGNDSVCKNVPFPVTASANFPGVTMTYAWAPSAAVTPGSSPSEVYYTLQSNSWIYVTATTNLGCSVQDSLYIYVGNVNGNVNATASPTYLVSGQTTTLSATPGGYNYSWTPTTGVSNPHAQTTTATVSETTVYQVKVTDGICEKSDTVKVITLVTLCDNRYVFVPNAFSPNGDNQNDILYVRSAIATTIEFRVFDRWGELIFESENTNDGWDGTFRGRKVDPDVYDYYLRAVCDDGQEHIVKGNITLIR